MSVFTAAIALIIFSFLAAPAYSDENSPVEISIPKKLLSTLKSFEPSAAIFLSDSNQFLLASDDTTEEDSPMLFLMDASGKVNKSPIIIEGMEKLTDIESINQDQDYIYTLSSQSRNKKGKVLKE